MLLLGLLFSLVILLYQYFLLFTLLALLVKIKIIIAINYKSLTFTIYCVYVYFFI